MQPTCIVKARPVNFLIHCSTPRGEVPSINGERTKLQVAQFKLSHSRAFFLRAYLLQTHEMLFDAHHHAFVAWGGIPRRGIYE